MKVEPTGVLGDTLFNLKNIKPPNYSGLNLEQQTGCEIDWLDFAADAGLDLSDDPPPKDTPPSKNDSGGCAIGQSPQNHVWPWIVVIFMWLTARRYGVVGCSETVNSRRKIVRIRSKLT